MVRDSLFLYKNINNKVLTNVSPVFHPAIASNYFIFNNNLSPDGSFVAYDSSTSNIKFPTVFNYKLKNNNNPYSLKLNSVVFNGDVGTRTDTPALPQTSGQIKLSKFAALSNSVPSVHLYFQGIIQVDYDFSGTYYGTGMQYESPSFSTGLVFPSSKTQNFGWVLGGITILEDGYTYKGDSITIKCNWDTSFSATSLNSNGSVKIPAITTLPDGIPTIYFRDSVKGEYNSGGDQPGSDKITFNSPQGGTEMYQDEYNIYWISGGYVYIPAGTYTIVDYWTDGVAIFKYSGSSTGYAKVP